MLLFAVRAIDLAIFGTLGGLWLGGAVFIYVLYRWIRRYEGHTAPIFQSRRRVSIPAPHPAVPSATRGAAVGT